MIVEVHDQFKGAVRIPATRVVVYDDFENPIAVVIKVAEGHHLAAHAGGNKQAFLDVLKMIGIDRALIIDEIDTRELPRLRLD